MTKKTNLFNKDNQLIGIKVETDKEQFIIPVADVRRNRGLVESIIKASNISKGSKFFKPSFSILGYSYNHSMKDSQGF